MQILYFDNNATHPPLPGILEESLQFYQSEFYNPSGLSRYSLQNQGKIEEARSHFSQIVGVKSENIVFSSSGTEANYLLAKVARDQFPEETEVLVSSYEHSSLYSAFRFFGLEPVPIPVSFSGKPDLDFLNDKLKERRRPVAVAGAVSETGVIHPLAEIKSIADEHSVPLFSDLIQVYGKTKMPTGLVSGGSVSSHKIGGGLGSALSFFQEGILKKDSGIFSGGFQENGHRAGTENFPSIIAFQKASRYQWTVLSDKEKTWSSLQAYLETEFESMGATVVAKESPRLKNTSFLILPSEDVDFFLLGMEREGILVSTGSSCKSRSREASSGLLAMGYSQQEALRAIRISMGTFTTKQEVERMLTISKKTLASLL